MHLLMLSGEALLLCAGGAIVFLLYLLWSVWGKKQLLLLEKAHLEERCAQGQLAQERIIGFEEALRRESARATSLEVELREERSKTAEKMQLLTEAEERFRTTFKALSADALSSNARAFLDLAQETLSRFQEGAKNDLSSREKSIDGLVAPLREALQAITGKVGELESARVGAYEGLKQQISALYSTQVALKAETSKLVSALKTPNVRGRWGEMQLRRVVELSGMLRHCDFEEQVSVTNDEGAFRPDMVVRLPGGRSIVVDAKAPLASYLSAIEAQDEHARASFLKEHAQHVRQHVVLLASKEYWQHVQPGPDFVVLFLPGEAFFSVALEHFPDLIERSMRDRVILATPTTLLALLHGVAAGWRQEHIAENAQRIAELGRELYKRLGDLGEHFSRLGKSLGSATEAYNQAISTLERRVLVSARRFKNLAGVSGIKDLQETPALVAQAKNLQADELVSFVEGDEGPHTKAL